MKTCDLLKEWLKDLNNDYAQCYNKYYGNKPFYRNLVKCLKINEETQSICHQIYNLALIKDEKMNILLFEILPSILKFYMVASVNTERNKTFNDDSVLILRSCLISIRELLSTGSNSEENNSILTLPGFAEGSIYHSSIVMPDMDVMSYKTPMIPYGINYEFNVVPDLIKLYSFHSDKYSSTSLGNFCEMSLRIVSLTNLPRIAVTTRLLSELTAVLNSLLFNEEHSKLALETLSAVEARANHECMASVILSVSAIMHAFYNRNFECPAFVTTDTMTHNRTTSINDTLITNATFRPEKVAEDIKAVTETMPNRNNNSNEIELNDIGLTFTSIKAANNVVKKSKIQFNLVDNFSSNNDTSIKHANSNL